MKTAHLFLFELTDLGEVGDEGQFMPDVAARLLLGVRRAEFGLLEVDSFLQKQRPLSYPLHHDNQ